MKSGVLLSPTYYELEPMSPQSQEARVFFHIRTAVRALRWVIIGLLALSAVLLVRLHMGPLSIDFLKPVAGAAFQFGEDGLRLEFDEGALSWGRTGGLGGDWSFLDLDLTGLRLVDGEGRSLLRLPRGRVRLSGVAMLAGRIAPAALEIEGLEFRLRWDGGDLVSALGRIGEGQEETAVTPAALLIALLSPPERGGAAGYLRQLSVANAEVVLEESLSGSRWRLGDADLRVSRGADNMLLNGTGKLSRDGTTLTRLDLAGVYSARSRTSHVELLFEDLNPSEVAGESEALAVLKAVDMPLSGSVGTTFGADEIAREVNFDLVGARGSIDVAGFYSEPLQFDKILVSGRYDLERRQAAFEDLRLEFVGAAIEGDGLLYESEGGYGLRFFASLRSLPFQWLKVYWPDGVGAGAHAWISRNVTAGRVTDGKLQLDLKPGMLDSGKLPPEAVDFSFAFDGVTAHYLRPMPPIVNGRGHAHLDTRTFELWIDNGVAHGVDVAGSHIAFNDIHLPGGQSSTIVAAKLRGSIDDVLEVIDYQPLGYPTKYGLDPKSVGGRTQIELDLSFPPVRSLTLADVAFRVRAHLSPLEMPGLFGDVGVTDGKLVLDVDEDGIAGTGTIALNAVPFQFRWQEDFNAAGNDPTRFELMGDLAGAQWDILSLPIAGIVQGPGQVRLSLTGRGADIRAGEGTIDFRKASLGFEELGWSKPVGVPAEARFRIGTRPSGELELPEVIYADSGLRASGSMVLGVEGGLKEMVIDSLKAGETHFAATVQRDPEDLYDIAVTAESFDARPFIQKTFRGGGTEGEYSMPSFSLDVFASRVLGVNDAVLSNLQVTALYRNDRWDDSSFVGMLTGGGGLKFELISPDTQDRERPRRAFSLTSDDAGEVARALGLFENAVGGVLSFTGSMSEPGDNQDVVGKVRVDDFRVVTAPTLARILSAGSFTGIRDLLAGDGIGFERLDVPYRFENSVITLRKARAWGDAIGLTMSGNLDLRTSTTRLKGVVVPAYSANSIIGKIPVLGKLLMGGKGEGLFAVNYEVTGLIDEPDIKVNPLSMLAPGFLRGIFGAFDEDKEDAGGNGKN